MLTDLNPVVGFAKCVFCNTVLYDRSVKLHCQRLECRLKSQQEELKKVHARRRQKERALDEKKGSYKKKWLEINPKYKNELPIVEVPYFHPGSEELSEKRIAPFEAHLREMISSLDRVEEEEKFRSPHGTPKKNELGAMLGKACGMCNGKCCRQGATSHAFIQRSTILRVLGANEGMEADQLVNLYKSYIPKIANKKSCVYHTTSGCCLPGELRADICDEFFCWNLDQHIEEHYDKSQPSQTMIFSVEEYEVKTVKLVSSNGDASNIDV